MAAISLRAPLPYYPYFLQLICLKKTGDVGASSGYQSRHINPENDQLALVTSQQTESVGDTKTDIAES